MNFLSRIFPWLILGLILIVLGSEYSFVVPKWDAGWYYNCLLNAVDTKDFKIGHLNCFAHISAGFFFIPWLLLKLNLGSSEILIYWNLFCLFIASLSVYGILRKFSGLSHAESLLSSFIFAFIPNTLSSVFHLNTDFGSLVFLAPALYFLISEKFFFAAIFGAFASLSKEPGAAMYGSMVLLYGALKVYSAEGTFKARILEITKKLWIPCSPVVIYLGRLVIRMIRVPDLPPVYTEAGFEKLSLIQIVLDFNIFNPTMKSYLGMIFILSFSWLLTLPLIFILFKIKRIKPSTIFLCFLLLAAVYWVTRLRIYSHPRYILMTELPLILTSASVLPYIIKNNSLRIIYLFITTLLIFFSNFRTFDPLSRSIWGTFNFGEHKLLNMSSLMHGDDGIHTVFNRDELVYNFENFELDYIANELFPALIKEPSTLILMSRNSRHYWPPRLELDTYKITGSRSNSYEAHCVDNLFVLQEDPPKADFYYLELPFASSPKDLQDLKSNYQILEERVFSHNGYTLKVYKFKTHSIYNFNG